jgi:outer membrane protein assembly factor BamB
VRLAANFGQWDNKLQPVCFGRRRAGLSREEGEAMVRTRCALVLAFAGLVAPFWCAASRADQAQGVAMDRLGVTRGVCVVIGDRQCQTAIDLARHSELTLFVQVPTAEEFAAACKAAEAAGLLGRRIFVAQAAPARIGLADNVADAAVMLDPASVAKAEVLRVLRPQGKAIAAEQTWTKPFPDGVDDWSHHYHGPDNNPQSKDRVARAPYLTQFIAEPRYAPAPQAAVSSAGRLFMAFGNVAWHEREEPAMNTLVALNAFNGTTLWKRPLTPGVMVDRSTMVATPEILYLADDKSCKLLDAATGKVRDEIVPPVEVTGGTFWKWMALDSGVLYALVGEAEGQDPDARWRFTHHGWPWDRISKGYNVGDYRWGFAKTLLAIDPKTKKILWTHQEDPQIDSRSLSLTGGRIYLAHFGHYVVCLDAKSGQMLWRRTAEKDPEVFKSIGPYRPGHGYVGGWKSTVYLKATDKNLYVLGPQVEWLTALSAADGAFLWRHPVKDLHLVIREEGLIVTGPQHSKSDETRKLDPQTGHVATTFTATQRRACTRSTGSCDAIFFRGHEGTGRLDLATGRTQWISTMRPSCQVGVVIANGHLYWVPWACDCNLQMFGAIALAPAGDFKFDQQAAESERLETVSSDRRGSPDPAETADRQVSTDSPNDWRTHRGNPSRTAHTQVSVPDHVQLLWQTPPQQGVEPSAPVAAGGLIFTAGSDGIVRARNAATGKVRWTSHTGGAIHYPPSIADGRALVGSADGWVYCLEAATGKRLWRFRAAPIERRIPLYGRLISTWPVASGVLVHDGTAYFAAGLNDFDGTHVYALDAATGRIRWQNNTTGHLDPESRRGVTCQGEMLLHEGKLYLAGGNTVSPAIFDAATGRCLNPPPTGMGSHAPRGRELILTGGQVRATGQPLYSLPSTPVYDQSLQWTEPVVHAKNADLTFRPVMGKDKSKPPSQWLLVALKPQTKQELWSQSLPAEPVRWGLAVDAQGRIVVSLRNGQVVCFAKR